MRAEIEDFKTGWFGVSILLKNRNITLLIHALQQLQNAEPTQHFHLGNEKLTGSGGIADVEFVKDEESGE